MTAAAAAAARRGKREKKNKTSRAVLASAGKFMALYTFRDSSRLQLLVFNVYGSRALLTGRLGLFPERFRRRGNETGRAY